MLLAPWPQMDQAGAGAAGETALEPFFFIFWGKGHLNRETESVATYSIPNLSSGPRICAHTSLSLSGLEIVLSTEMIGCHSEDPLNPVSHPIFHTGVIPSTHHFLSINSVL